MTSRMAPLRPAMRWRNGEGVGLWTEDGLVRGTAQCSSIIAIVRVCVRVVLGLLRLRLLYVLVGARQDGILLALALVIFLLTAGAGVVDGRLLMLRRDGPCSRLQATSAIIRTSDPQARRDDLVADAGE